MKEAVSDILTRLGVDLKDHNFTETPERYEKALEELLSERHKNPPDLKAFPSKSPGEIVFVGGLAATSLCPHHLFPYLISASFAYIPTESVVGISKPGRLLKWVCGRLILQEEIGPLFLHIFNKQIGSVDSIIMIKGVHLCSTIRGAKQDQSSVITMASSGEFRSDSFRRKEFFNLVRASNGREK